MSIKSKADDWVEITLYKGDIVWGGAPEQSNFYTSNEVAEIVGADATKLYEGLPVLKTILTRIMENR